MKITEDNERVRVIKDHENVGFYELVIPVVKASDAGHYKCIANNIHGEASCEASLTVSGKLYSELQVQLCYKPAA